MKKFLSTRFIVVSLMILAAVIFRIIPHLPNFTPVAAIALFGGAYFGKKYFAFIVPIIAMLLSDVVIGIHSNMIAVYVAFIITVFIGIAIKNKVNIGSVVVAALSSSILFFLITNFASWMTGLVGYPMNFTGLMMAYEAGIPFFRNEIMGTLVYSGVLFGIFELAKAKIPALKIV